MLSLVTQSDTRSCRARTQCNTRNGKRKMTFLRNLLIVVALGSLLPSVSFGAPPEIPTPKRFHDRNFDSVRGIPNSGLRVAMIIHEIEGKIAICGARWPQDEKRGKNANRNLSYTEGTIKLRGKVLPVSLYVFPFYETRDAAIVLRCAVSDQTWQGPYQSRELAIIR